MVGPRRAEVRINGRIRSDGSGKIGSEGAIAQQRERPRPRVAMTGRLEQRVDDDRPPGRTRFRPGEEVAAQPRGLVVPAGERQGRCGGHDGLNGVRIATFCQLVRSTRHGRETDSRHRMTGHARQRFTKRRFGILAALLPKSNRADRVPRVRGALARVDVTVMLECQQSPWSR